MKDENVRIVRSRNRVLSYAVAVMSLVSPAIASGQDPDSTVMQRGRELTQQFYDGNTDPIVAALDEAMRSAMGGAAGLATFREQVEQQLGGEAEVLDERVIQSGVHRVYHRSARFEKMDARIAVVWAFDADGRVAGFSIRPEQPPQQAAASQYLDYETRTPLRLPFNEEWTVFWGGRTIEQNYHLQNAPAFGSGDGLPVQFLHYFANDSLVARGEPIKGQRIRPSTK